MISNLIERFGSDIVNLNLNPEEIFLLKNKGVLSGDTEDKLRHLEDSPFDNLEELVKFISRLLGVDIPLISDDSAKFLNEMLFEFYEVRCVNPHFDPSKPNTWCELIDNSLITASETMPNHVTVMELSESSNVSDSKIKENVYDSLDDDSVRLLYGLMTGSYSLPYNRGMRDTVYNEVKNKKNDSAVGRVVLHSLKEGAVGLHDLMESHGIDVAMEVQSKDVHVFDKDGCVFACNRMGDNQYIIQKLK